MLTTAANTRDTLLCPSSQPEVEGARVPGVVHQTFLTRTTGRLAPLFKLADSPLWLRETPRPFARAAWTGRHVSR
jgi:hypothetical protein